MKAGAIPRFAVYVDGLVREVCGIYRDFPAYLTPALRKRASQGKDPLFPEGGEEEFVTGPPCCIVASSGMLTGGANVVYARLLASNQENLICITGPLRVLLRGRAGIEVRGPAPRSPSVRTGFLPVGCATRRARSRTLHFRARTHPHRACKRLGGDNAFQPSEIAASAPSGLKGFWQPSGAHERRPRGNHSEGWRNVAERASGKAVLCAG
jgi:hypothetical protein